MTRHTSSDLQSVPQAPQGAADSAAPPQAKPGGKQPTHHAPKSKIAIRARAQAVVNALAAGASMSAAGQIAGYTGQYCDRGARALLRNPVVQEAFPAILERAGVTDCAIADRLRSLMDARTLKRFGKENIEIDDNGTQLGAVQLAAKLRGHLVDRSVQVQVQAGFIDLGKYGQSGAADGQSSPDPAQVVDVSPGEVDT